MWGSDSVGSYKPILLKPQLGYVAKDEVLLTGLIPGAIKTGKNLCQ